MADDTPLPPEDRVFLSLLAASPATSQERMDEARDLAKLIVERALAARDRPPRPSRVRRSED